MRKYTIEDILLALALLVTLVITFTFLSVEKIINRETVKNIIVPLFAIAVALLTYRWANREWRLKFLTEKWSDLVEFLVDYPQFMDGALNAAYKTQFQGSDAQQYEMIARLCLSYLDDMYFLGYGEELGGWVRGSVKFLGGTHYAWFLDHKNSYHPEFVQYIEDCMQHA